MEAVGSRVGQNQLQVLGLLAPLAAVLVLAGASISITLIVSLIASLLIYKYRRVLYIVIVTLPRDCRFIYRIVRLVLRTRRYEKDGATVVSVFRKRAEQHPDKPCFYFEDQVWTSKDVSQLSNRVARVFQDAGFRRGDVVALLMENRPEYVAIWLGLAQLGVVTALINTNQRLLTLQHSINVAKPRAIIVSTQLASAIADVRASIPDDADVYELGEGDVASGVKSLDALLRSASDTAPEVADPPQFRDKLMYIYTSGTTGLPKAAIILHSRYLLITMASVCMLALREDDVIYDPLPLYHTSGGAVGVGPTLAMGVSTVIRSKFSASNYWPDCVKYNCTVAQYIGEMCRYILNTPPRPHDSEHKVRVMVGNGLKTAIWKQFVDRFQVPEIRELYGATEGNANTLNLDNTVGAVGALPWIARWFKSPMGLIRVNMETGEPIRGPDGCCVKCDVDEPGMYVGIISSGPATEFHGYADRAESSKKVISDVFTKGDKAYISGDLLTMDELGYLFFTDRTGDTYRWKGENVSTAEVEAIVSSVIGLNDATVYGVEIPGTEGRAGMAAIADPDRSLDIAVLAEALDKLLPSYAQPIFIRTLRKIDVTGTYKLRKVDLQKEGFNPAVVKDDLYFRRGRSYVPLTAEVYSDIVSGKERL